MKRIGYYLMMAAGLLFVLNSCENELSLDSNEDLMNLQEDASKNLLSEKEMIFSANGNGTVNFEDGIKRHFVFHANQMPDGSVEGNGSLTITAGEVQIKFNIDCMEIIDNSAIMTGYITRFDEEPQFENAKFWFRVYDNGEGNNSPPDVITYFYFWTVEVPTCDMLLDEWYPEYFRSFEIESGNIQVK